MATVGHVGDTWLVVVSRDIGLQFFFVGLPRLRPFRQLHRLPRLLWGWWWTYDSPIVLSETNTCGIRRPDRSTIRTQTRLFICTTQEARNISEDEIWLKGAFILLLLLHSFQKQSFHHSLLYDYITLNHVRIDDKVYKWICEYERKIPGSVGPILNMDSLSLSLSEKRLLHRMVPIPSFTECFCGRWDW